MDLPAASLLAADPPRIALEAPYEIIWPLDPHGPLVFASPHSGRTYPDALLAAAQLDLPTLRRSEDSFLETLFSGAPRFGAPLIHALFPRVWCDANREPWELDPAMFEERLPAWVNSRSSRVAAGLGTIARVVATGDPIYRRRLTFAEAEERITTCWQPFHNALNALLEQARKAHGYAILIDCHSMPSTQSVDGRLARMPDFVLGDAHGTACAEVLTRTVERRLEAMGYSVRRNDPYAGGYITRHYGSPRQNVHALQIEINRALYMDEQTIEPTASLARLKADLEGLVADLASTDWCRSGLAGG